MPIGVGVLVTRSIWVGAVEGARLGNVEMYPAPGQQRFDLRAIHCGQILAEIRRMVAKVREGAEVVSVGAAFPGVVRNGTIEDSPNLGQLKGFAIASELAAALKADGIDLPVKVINDADALASGIAVTRNAELPVRVWYLGDGV